MHGAWKSPEGTTWAYSSAIPGLPATFPEHLYWFILLPTADKNFTVWPQLGINQLCNFSQFSGYKMVLYWDFNFNSLVSKEAEPFLVFVHNLCFFCEIPVHLGFFLLVWGFFYWFIGILCVFWILILCCCVCITDIFSFTFSFYSTLMNTAFNFEVNLNLFIFGVLVKKSFSQVCNDVFLVCLLKM